ncbi:imidazolonepropionase [Candidatus Zixiibacteriota bacterium]
MSKADVDLVVKNIGQLLTLQSQILGPRCGSQMEDLGIIQDGAVACAGGKIVAVGTTREVESACSMNSRTEVIDARGRIVIPGFVDPHTHPVFAGTREEEFELRIKGASYQEIAASGGGIRSSVRALREATKEELNDQARSRLDRLLSLGTTTAEAKSGYGLNLEDEVKSLEVIADLNGSHPLDLIPTFLGAHEVPDEHRDSRGEYIRLLREEIIPLVAERDLAEFCDIFCEQGVFDVDESREILIAARVAGLKLKLHADELAASGGSMLAAELSAVSADHLVHIDQKGIEAMSAASVMAVLLPGTTFHLGGDRYAPARRMIGAGLPVALATDLNPGSCMTESMPMIITLACLHLKMTAAEAIVAATINAAHAVDRGDTLGSLETGKQADLVIWEMDSYKILPYHFGVNLVDTVIKAGRVVYRQGQTLY